MTSVTLIAAVGRNGVIGADNDMPWHLPEDFAFFKRTTMGHPMVMGRRTFDSIGRVLPGRRTIVITRQPDWSHADVETAHSLSEALALAGPADEVFVCGGGQVYAEAMPFAQRLLITEVDQAPEGDVTFPEIDRAHWREVSRERRDGFSWVAYERA
ncbi:dihydrofolate reductase [Pedococcus sp. NPDC057267]|uniref:dihydrofolate reductase n=1 Tax=Pedococcus sp. NPDC057267 TaxID=3346077 RepID=UPI003626EBE1